MKKRYKFLIFIAVITACFTLGLFGLFGCDKGCGNGCGEEPDNQTTIIKHDIVLGAEQITLDIEESYKLSASIVGTTENNFNFSIDNSDVAEISSNGTITAKRVGTTRVVVSAEGCNTVYCQVNVALADNLPQVFLDNIGDKDIELSLGTTFELHPKVLFKNNIYDDAEFTFALADNSYGNFATSAGAYSFNSAKKGEVQLTVTASWRNVESFFLTKEYKVVIKDNVYIEINDGLFNGSVSLLTYAEPGVDQLKTTENFKVAVYKNGQKQELTDSNFSVVIENTNIATLNNYVITASNQGETLITIAYNDGENVYTQKFPLKVERPIRNLTDKITYFSSNDKLDVALLISKNVEVIDAYQDGERIDVVNESGKYYVTGAKADKTGVKQSELTFYTEEKIGYTIKVDVYGLVVSTPEEFEQIPNFADSSVILINDIDMAGKNAFTINTLTGTIDGNGYTVSNLRVKAQGFCKIYKEGSVLRNISFDNMLGNTPSGSTQTQVYLGADDWEGSSGLIKNVYLKTDMTNAVSEHKTSGSVIFGGASNGNLKVENCIFVYPSVDVANNQTPGYSNKYGLFGSVNYYDMSATRLAIDTNWKNVYIISQSINGNVMPVAVGEKHLSGSNTAGACGYALYASNDLAQEFEVSLRNNLAFGGVTYYFMFPTYKFVVDGQGKVTITKTNLESLTTELATTAGLTKTSESVSGTTYVKQIENLSTVGLGVYRLNAVTRLNSVNDFVTEGISLAEFDQNYWDISLGYPVWKNS